MLTSHDSTPRSLKFKPEIFSQVLDQARQSAANDARWLNAINKAASHLTTNPWLYIDGTTLIIGSPSGQVYAASVHEAEQCQCLAYQFGGKPCWHRALASLYTRYVQALEERRAQYEKALFEINELFAA